MQYDLLDSQVILHADVDYVCTTKRLRIVMQETVSFMHTCIIVSRIDARNVTSRRSQRRRLTKAASSAAGREGGSRSIWGAKGRGPCRPWPKLL